MKRQTKKSSVLRARCEAELKSLVAMAAKKLGLDEADIVRMASQKFSAQILTGSTSI